MGRQVALLRGVNVGGHRRVPMGDLRALAESIGFRDAATHLQSGNLVYGTALGPEGAAARLERAIEGRFGFAVDVVARTAAQWRALARSNPFRAAAAKEPERLLLVLTKSPPDAAGVEALAARAGAGEAVAAAGGGVWIHYGRGVGRSKLTPALLDRLLGSPATGRNAKTVAALERLLG